VFRCLTEVGGSEDRPTQSSEEPGLPPELALGRDRSPNRAVWTTQEPDTRASRSGETALRGAEALEARSPSTAVPKRCRGARLLGVEAAEAAASTSGISVTRRELDPPKWGEETLSS
jgi:hypothetical protein